MSPRAFGKTFRSAVTVLRELHMRTACATKHGFKQIWRVVMPFFAR
jgi:hypothetical protein